MSGFGSEKEEPSLRNLRAGYKTVSQAALSALLQDISKHGLPKATSRSSIKRSKDLEVDIETPYGKLLMSKSFQLSEKYRQCRQWEFHFVNPAAFLHYICATCDDFASVFWAAVSNDPPTIEVPLKFVCYMDDVVAGNPLANRLGRKFQIAYWSIYNLGVPAMSCERFWFPLVMARSEVVRKLPGRMAQLMKEALLLFRQPFDFQSGLVFNFTMGRLMLYARVGIYVADEGALKETFEFRGASGTRLCPLCANIVGYSSELYLHSSDLISSTSADRSKVQRASKEFILSTLNILDSKKRTSTKTGFEKRQKFAGWTWNPESPLLNTVLEIDLPAEIMFDYMHTFFVNGLWNLEVALLLPKLQETGFDRPMLHSAIQEFVFPDHLNARGVTGKQVFVKECKESSIGCTASEACSLYAVVRFLLIERYNRGELNSVKPALDSYMKLCRVLDLLLDVRRGCTTSSDLTAAADAHLQAFVKCYTASSVLPKHHYGGHLGEMLQRFDGLIGCFCLERKHREFKRWASLSDNTPASWERGVLRDALVGQLDSLRKHDEGCEFQEPGRELKAFLAASFGQADITVADKVCLSDFGATVARGDVVVFSTDGTLEVGQTQFFARVLSSDYACISKWRSRGHNMFDVADSAPVLCPLSCILDSCIHVKRGSNVAVVPITTRDSYVAG